MTIVRLLKDKIHIIQIQKNKSSYTLLNHMEIKRDESAKHTLTQYKNIRLLYTEDETIEEEISLPSVIKNEATLQKAVLVKLQDRLITESLILNRVYASNDPTQESTTHYFEGVKESPLLDELKLLPHWEYVDQITTERSALFALSEYLYHGKSYLSVHTQEDKNLIVAVHNGKLLFSRIGELQSHDEIERVMEQLSDITRTVAYAHQQYREANFEFIAISGSIADGEMAPMQLSSMTGLQVSVIAPNLIIKGADPLVMQSMILEFGTLFIDKNHTFLPNQVRAAKEFYWGSFLTIIIALFIMLGGLYTAYNAYTPYADSLDRLKNTEVQLNQTLHHTLTLDDTMLKRITARLNSAQLLEHHLIDDLILFEPIFQIIKPNNIQFTDKTTCTLEFKKLHPNLLSLYLFEKKFKNQVSDLKNEKITAIYKTDYNSFTFEASLKYGEKEVAPPPQRRRRR